MCGPSSLMNDMTLPPSGAGSRVLLRNTSQSSCTLGHPQQPSPLEAQAQQMQLDIAAAAAEQQQQQHGQCISALKQQQQLAHTLAWDAVHHPSSSALATPQHTTDASASADTSLPCSFSTDSLQQHAQGSGGVATTPLAGVGTTTAPAGVAAGQGQLFVGTSAGVFLLDLARAQFTLLGLPHTHIGHLDFDAASGFVLASCPVQDDAGYDPSSSAQRVARAREAAGLYCLNLAGSRRSSCTQAGGAAASGGLCFGACCSGSVQTIKLWNGSASSSALVPAAAQAPVSDGDDTAMLHAPSPPPGPPRIYLGTQPAGLMVSDDLGGTWTCCSLDAAPNADQWFRRQPPYEPSVRSIAVVGKSKSSRRRSSGSGSRQSSADGSGEQLLSGAAAPAEQQQLGPELLVAVEVGGVLAAAPPSSSGSSSGSDGGLDDAAAACSSSSSSGWRDVSQGLCKDVHALQPDPFNSQRLYAVCGSGHLPGGLYRCKGRGQKWKRLFGYRYSVGMAVSPFQKGRLLLTSADKPPAIGCSLFESVDAGRTWANITDDVADAAAELTGHEPGLFEATPLATYVQGGVVLACATGHVFFGAASPLGGFHGWRLVAQLPHAITCMCGVDPLVGAVSITRG